MWPGLAARSYAPSELVPLRLNKLSSTRTQVPYAFYSLPFCRPYTSDYAPENLGEVLLGSVIQNAPFEVRLGVGGLRALCKLPLDQQGRQLWSKRIREQYRGQLLLDNLPVTTKVAAKPSTRGQPARARGAQPSDGFKYTTGYPLGYVDVAGRESGEPKVYLHNHLDFTVQYHVLEAGGESPTQARVVGFEVEPSSRRYSHTRKWPEDFEGPDGEARDVLNLKPETVGLALEAGPLAVDSSLSSVIFTYNVTWVPSSTPYSSRWDVYLYVEEGTSIHWLSLTGSLATSLLLAGVVATILIRTIRRDLQRYNLDDGDEASLDVRWKYCHTDVLRPPANSLLLATLVGSGVQLTCVLVASVLLSLIGLLAPTSRGVLLTAGLVLFAAAGLPAGGVAVLVYRQMHGRRPYLLMALLVGLVPGAFFAFFLLLDVRLWAQESSSAVPMGTMVALLALWLCLDAPLVSLGVALGARSPRLADPVFTTSIPRQVPHQPALGHPMLTALLGGFLPFGAASIELAIVLSCVWNQRIYFMFGFFMLMILTTSIVCAEVGVVLCYFQLCREDYRWWWRAFNNPGFAGVYLYLYAILYAHYELHLPGLTAKLIYFGYMGAAAISFYLMAGAISFVSTYTFVFTIYSSLKVD